MILNTLKCHKIKISYREMLLAQHTKTSRITDQHVANYLFMVLYILNNIQQIIGKRNGRGFE